MEQWERIIEIEIDYYVNVQKYENELLERYYESQIIRMPSTLFNEEEGIMYIKSCSTEDQALYRMEMQELTKRLIQQIINRVNRLGRALEHLTDDEMDIISICYLENSELSGLQMARSLGYRTLKEFAKEKDRVLRKLYTWYIEDREHTTHLSNVEAKEETKRKAKQWLEG